jgi:hypothetical protein
MKSPPCLSIVLPIYYEIASELTRGPPVPRGQRARAALVRAASVITMRQFHAMRAMHGIVIAEFTAS